MAMQFTPWQKMRAYETQTRKIEDHYINLERLKKKCEKPEEGVIIAEMDECKPYYTYFNNGKVNCCCKTPYDYNFGYHEGYDQNRHRCDRKHRYFYLNHDIEEQYPCRTIPILTSSNYGHRPRIDFICPLPKVSEIHKFRRANGTKYCIDANGYQNVKLNPIYAFKANQSYGYTYSPPVN